MGITAIIGYLLQLIVTVMGILLDRAKAKKEAKEAYYNFVIELSNHGLLSASMKQDVEYQIEQLNKKNQ